MESLNFNELQVAIRRDFKDGEQQLVLFRRQYLQRLDVKTISWPESSLLEILDVQRWLFCFIDESMRSRPYPQYDKIFLKELVKRLEQAVEDMEEPVCLHYQPWNSLCG